jgi:serine phosphatase RsbU (regulator of sigma subunit)
MIDAFYRAVLDFSAGTRQGDDLTAVIVKRIAVGERAVGSPPA